MGTGAGRQKSKVASPQEAKIASQKADDKEMSTAATRGGGITHRVVSVRDTTSACTSLNSGPRKE